MGKAQIKKDMYDTTHFLELLSSLSLNELMELEFRFASTTNWLKMVFCKDRLKKLYSCNVCQVKQSSEKNLFSHLFGKKHFQKMETVNNIRLPKNMNPTTVNAKTTQPNKAHVAAVPVVPTVPAVPVPKPKVPVGLKSTPNIIKIKTSGNNNLATKTNTNNTQAAKNAVATKPKSPVETAKKQPAAVVKKVLVTKPKIPAAAPKQDVANKPENPEKPEAIEDTSVPKQSNESEDTSVPEKSNECEDPSVPKKTNESDDTSVPKKTNECEDKLIAAKEISKPTNVPKLNLLKETKAKTPTTTNVLNPLAQPNVVLNPLSKAAQERKITCVPISKLINKTEVAKDVRVVVNVDDDDDVVMLTPATPAKKNKADEHDKVTENPPNPNPNSSTQQIVIDPLPAVNLNATVSTFETSANVSEVLGLLGVEYVLKIVKSISDTAPRFLCSLCSITTDELSMHNHLLSNNHRLKYCEQHFPTAIRQYKQYIAEVPEHQVYKILSPILNKLAIAIETHHGRENSYLCYEYWFTKNKQSLIQTVFNRRHASEVLGPTFTHVVDSKEVDVLIENAKKKIEQPVNTNMVNHMVPYRVFNNSQNYSNTYRQPVVNTNYLHNIQTVDDETHKRMVENFLRDTRPNEPQRHRNSTRNSKRAKRSRSKSKSAERKRKRSTTVTISQWNIERRSVSPLRDGDIWQAYRHMVDLSVRELNTTFDVYKADPEEHPQYKDEWQKFWKRRKDELIAAGINHRSYNYQGEWILFFNARLEELYNQDVENIKIKCRERLCLPMTNSELANSKYHVNIPEEIAEPEPEPEPEPESDPEPELEPEIEPVAKALENRLKPIESTEEVNVIHVLRLLTALENFLGSLGPNITELLAKALQLSKLHPDKINQMILTTENCAILETAKEKFTGLIISKILDANQERALKKAVNDTECLLSFATEVRSKMSNEWNQQTEEDRSNAVHKMSEPLDKSALAAKLASSLISQGKTRINQDQLKQIIQVYSLMEQKKQHEIPSTSQTVNNNATLNSRTQQNQATNDYAFQTRTNSNNQTSNEYSFQGRNNNQTSFQAKNNTQSANEYSLPARNNANSNPTSNDYSLQNISTNEYSLQARNTSINNQTANEYSLQARNNNQTSNDYSFQSRNNSNNNQTTNEYSFPSRNNNNFAAPNQQSYNANQSVNRHGFTNQQQFMASDSNNMKTSSNYLTANMARSKNNTTNINNNANYKYNAATNTNTNSNGRGFSNNGQQGFDSGQFTGTKTNQSTRFMDSPYSLDPPRNNTGWKPNWMN